MEKRVEQAKKGWVDLLPEILWVYHTTTKNPTGETPFFWAYDKDAVVFIEMNYTTV